MILFDIIRPWFITQVCFTVSRFYHCCMLTYRPMSYHVVSYTLQFYQACLLCCNTATVNTGGRGFIGIPIIKLSWSCNRLSFIMGLNVPLGPFPL